MPIKIHSQARLKIAASGKISLGAFLTPIKNTSEDKWTSGLGSAIMLEPSLKIRWKNSFSFSIGGGLNLYNYDFRNSTLKKTNGRYTINYFGLKTDANITKYFYIGRKIEYISIGTAAGFAYHSNEHLLKENSNFLASTTTLQSNPLFISPQIGTYKRDDRFGYSIMLQFTHFYLNSPFIYFRLSSNNSLATANHNGSYLGLNLIIDYDLRKKTKSFPPEWNIALPKDRLSRKKENQGNIDCKRHKATIWIWDFGILDNDTISLLVNNKVVLSKHEITHNKKKIKVILQSGENSLEMIAHNEGSVKPNSAAIKIRSGFRKKSFTLNSTMNSTANINLNYLYRE